MAKINVHRIIIVHKLLGLFFLPFLFIHSYEIVPELSLDSALLLYKWLEILKSVNEVVFL